MPRMMFRSAEWLAKRQLDKFDAMVSLFEQASYVDGRKMELPCGSVTLRRGQLVTTVRTLAEQWGWKKDSVVRYLASLEQRASKCGFQIKVETIFVGDATDTATTPATSTATAYMNRATLVTFCNYDSIIADSSSTDSDYATAPTTGTTTATATLYSIETKNKESYKERENECVEKEKKEGTRTHTHSQKNDNHLVSTTDCVVGAAHGICNGSKNFAERAAKPMKSVDDLSQEKENVAPKEKEGGTAGRSGVAGSARSGAGAATAGAVRQSGAATGAVRQSGAGEALTATAGTGVARQSATVGTPTRQTAMGTATATAMQPAESAMFAVPGATERETAQGGELLRWFRTTYPDLAAMQYPMTLEQAVWLLRSYSLPDIRFVIDRMRSKEAFRTNTAFYSTFIAFARRDKDIVRRDAQKVYRA